MQPDAKRLLVLVQIGRRQLGLDDETYRTLLAGACGVRSAKGLSAAQLAQVLAVMQQAGFKPTAKPAVKQSVKQPGRPFAPRASAAAVIRAVWITMARHGVVRDGSDGALDAWVARQSSQLNGGVGVARLAWLDDDLAARLLEALKRWHKRVLQARLADLTREGITTGANPAMVGASYRAVVAAYEESRHVHPIPVTAPPSGGDR